MHSVLRFSKGGLPWGLALVACAGLVMSTPSEVSAQGSDDRFVGDWQGTLNAGGQELPFVMVVADDERWGIVESGQVPRYGEPINSDLGPLDFAAVANGLGALGTTVDSAAALREALRMGLAERRPVLIHVPTTGGMPGADAP